MSNAFLRGDSNGGDDILQITTEDGIAIPVAGNINLFAESSSVFSESGIITNASGSTANVVITNRASGQVTTTDATPTTIITLPLENVPSVYSLTGITSLIIPSNGDGASYFFDAAIKTDGITATEVGSEYPTTFEDASLALADILVVVSGNSVILQVVGVAATTIRWDAILTFRRVI